MTTTTSATTSTSATTATSTSTSKSSLGASIVSSLNAGSGIDTDSLVTNLTAAQKASLEDPITAKQTANAAQISAAASVSSYITTFSSSLDTLIAGGTLMTQPNSSNTSVMTVSAIAGQKIANLPSSVTVNALAKGQTIESQPVTVPSAGFASGTITITADNGQSVSVDAGNGVTDLASLVAAINKQSSTSGMTASVVSDSSGSHLVLKGATGAKAGFDVQASGDFQAFAYSRTADTTSATPDVAAGSGMQKLQSAQDASYSMDGVTYTSATNTISDVLQGVKMTLVATGTSALSETRPGDAISSAISDFVSAYNALKAEMDTETAAATTSTAAGALRGNSTIRDMQRQLSKLTTTPLIASGNITTLAQLGVKTAQDGTLSVDTTVLNKMIAAYPDDVEAMFNPAQSSSNAGVTITSAVGKVSAGTYALTNLTSGGTAGSATGSVNGVAMTGVGATLTAPTGSGADGLTLTLANGLSNATGTLSIDLGLSGALAMIKDAMTGTNGSITTLQSRLTTQSTTLADQLTKADAQVTVYHDRLVTQFSAMNTRVSAYKATQSYLTQQVDLWTKSTS